MGLEAAELARWTRFAAKGGIGKCVALCDCVAESQDDLMFLKDDEITVLFQIPESEGSYLGYCEGVVGRFNGTDVRFTTRLKKPVMTKRASVSATSTKSPSPSLGKSPSPAPTNPTTHSRRNSSRRNTHSLERRGSLSTPNHIISPLASSVMLSDDDVRRPPHMSYSSTSTGSESQMNSPAYPVFPPSVTQEKKKSGSYGTPSPRDAIFPAESSSSAPATRPPSPPTVSVSEHHGFIPTNTNASPLLPQAHPQIQHRYTALAPSPLNLAPDTTSPLRITKRSPTSPPASSTSPYTKLPLSPPAPLSSEVPDTTYSSFEDRSKRLSLGLSDAQGIGLSLLQDLASGMDSDSDDDDDGRWSRSSKYSGAGDGKLDGDAIALRRVGQGQRDSINGSQEGTAEGLGYAMSEDSHTHTESNHQQVQHLPPPPVPTFDHSTQHNTAETRPKEQAAPTPNARLSPATSPTSPSFPSPNLDARRPSLAPSAASTGSWEGASDIYDDYRYSRYSIASKMSRMSTVNSIAGGSTYAPPVPHSEGRPSIDSTRQRVDSARSKVDVHSPLGLSQVLEASAAEREEEAEEKGDSKFEQKKRSTFMSLKKERTMSVDSDASVYTQNSRLSTLSQDAVALMSVPEKATESHSQPQSHTQTRPAPLTLVQDTSPLLNTTWGSPLSSPDYAMSPKSSSTFYTPLPGSVGRGQGMVMSPGLGGGGLTSPTLGGFASAMRQKLEEERRSPNPDVQRRQENDMEDYVKSGGERQAMAGKVENEKDANHQQQNPHHSVVEGEGLGHRIVIEDEDELPSRILNSTFNESPSSSPEPELLFGKHLAPLVVANRTPSPSINEGASDEGGLASRLRMLDEGDNESNPSSRRGTPRISEPSSPMIPSNPPLPPSTPPTQSQDISNSPSPSHLRPSLRELREGGTVPVPGTNQRRSLFLPHPNAPKAPPPGGGASSGPHIVAQQPPQQPQTQSPPLQGQQTLHPPPQFSSNTPQVQQQPPPPQHPQQNPHHHPNPQWNPNGPQPPPQRPNLFGVIRMALSLPPRGPNPPPPGPIRPTMPPRGPTIYGRTEVDLGASVGPVPIVWSIEPPPAKAPPHSGQHQQGAMPPPRVQMMAKSQASRSKSLGPGVVGNVGRAPGVGAGNEKGGVGVGVGRGLSVGPGVGGISAAGGGSGVATAGGPQKGVAGANDQKAPAAGGGVIPRANFVPKAAGLRPRSRSFSGFNSTTQKAPVPVQRSREDSEIPSARDVKRSLTTSVSAPSTSSPLSSASSSSTSPSASTPPSSKPSLSSSPLRPSPLSLSSVGLKPAPLSPTLKSPGSPLAQSTFTAPRPDSPSTTNPPPSPGFGSLNPRPPHQLRQTSSRSTLNESLARAPISRTTLPTAPSTSAPLNVSSPPFASNAATRTTSLQVVSRRDVTSPNPRSDPDAASVHSTRSQLTSPPPITRQTSLRSKLSLPNLRRKQSKQDEDVIVNSPPNTNESELLQVQDMEFELVRPSLSRFTAAARTSEDSGVLARESSLDFRHDSNGFLRAESPAGSTLSSAGRMSEQRSPTIEGSGNWIPQTSSNSTSAQVSRSNTDTESSMDAHRQRELKWMSLMSSNPPSQARKSKKVKKLVVEGVPSSVRYLVWSYLTDGKARCVPGVYSQLSGRGKISVSVDIDRDIKVSFEDQPHLQGTQGPVLLLLQAYLNMVPDVVYSRGLTLIVGQLLLLSPEEDAFWIFVSIMDTHIRSYFSTSTTQMEVDSALFSRALEVNDNVIAKKLLVDMGMSPPSICQPWFSSLFVGTLPPEYLNRVWDLFLFEGVPFLIRVALALITCCRRKILESTTEESVLQALLHPPQAWLPASPEGFLSLAFGVKLKDDDVRKQRVKMEAQIKRQTQVPRVASTSGMISLPRT